MPRMLGEELQGLVQSRFGSFQEFGYNETTSGTGVWDFDINSAASGTARLEVLKGWL